MDKMYITTCQKKDSPTHNDFVQKQHLFLKRYHVFHIIFRAIPDRN